MADADDAVRLERLDRLIDDIRFINEDLAEFFGDEFAGSRNLLDRVLDTLRDAAMEPTDA